MGSTLLSVKQQLVCIHTYASHLSFLSTPSISVFGSYSHYNYFYYYYYYYGGGSYFYYYYYEQHALFFLLISLFFPYRRFLYNSNSMNGVEVRDESGVFFSVPRTTALVPSTLWQMALLQLLWLHGCVCVCVCVCDQGDLVFI